MKRHSRKRSFHDILAICGRRERAASVFLLSLIASLSVLGEVELDKAELTQVEELSESLANSLLEFSVTVRERDMKRIGQFFESPARVTPWPSLSGAADTEFKWISTAVPRISRKRPKKMTRAELMKSWERLLQTFSSVEDARFQVRGAVFTQRRAETRGKGDLKFFLIGRDSKQHRFWVKGTGRLVAVRTGKENWRISEFQLAEVRTMRAAADLFSEVSIPAGVSNSLPRYGEPGNDDFVYHGAAAGDLNQDGLQDLVVTGINRNYLYLNQGGRFQDVADKVGISITPPGTAPLLLDYDNDGDLDVFMASVGEQMLFENRLVPSGKLLFFDISQEVGIAVNAIGFSATAADVNGDGWTDIYVASYNRYGRVMPDSWHRASNGTPNLLFLNQGNGSFRESGAEWGVRDQRWSYAAQFVDINGDGRLDLYVANDFGENGYYVNLGDRFEDRATAMGLLDPGNGMGVSFGDFNNDGRIDLYVTNMSSTAGNRILDRLFPQGRGDRSGLKKLAAGNTLFEGVDEGGFRDVSAKFGPFVAGWAWGGVFVDFDNDGWEDLYSPNGFISGKSMKDT